MCHPERSAPFAPRSILRGEGSVFFIIKKAARDIRDE